MRKLGWDVILAFDGAQALSAAKNIKPDAIVLDINMPGGTGVGVLEKLQMNTNTSMIPVLVLSGSVDKEMKDKILQLGATDYMSKPVGIEALNERLELIIKGNRSY